MSLTMDEIKERILRVYDPDDLLEALESHRKNSWIL